MILLSFKAPFVPLGNPQANADERAGPTGPESASTAGRW
jgi:hypothetical protein